MIAVTGANGLVGSFVVQRLVQEGLPVVAIVRAQSRRELLDAVKDKITFREADVLDMPDLSEALTGCDMAVHCAAMVSFNRSKSKKIIEVNVEGTKNVVNACLQGSVKKLVHVSSVAALGRVKGMDVIDENS